MPLLGSFSTGSGGAAVEPSPPIVTAAAITSGGTLDEITIAEAGGSARTVTTLWGRPADAVVASDTNYIAFEWFLRNAAGVQTATVSIGTTVTEGTGDLDAFERFTATVEWTIPAGGCITMTATSIGTGTFPRASYGADFDL